MSALDFPSSPSDGDTYEGYVYNAAKGVWQWQALTTPANGYTFVDTVYFTSNGTFSKGDYPWLRAIKVKMVGGGGGGGATQGCGNNEAAAGGGGSGGSYSESFYTDIAGLSSSISVTVGAGGSGGTGGVDGNTGTEGGGGGQSAFGAQNAVGGAGGNLGFEFTGIQTSSSKNKTSGFGSGDLVFAGGASGMAISIGKTLNVDFNRATSGSGGSSAFGGGGQGQTQQPTGVKNGSSGLNYGGGGGGGAASSDGGGEITGADGGNGANGIVIVELFA